MSIDLNKLRTKQKFRVGMSVTTVFGRGTIDRVYDHYDKQFSQRFYYLVHLPRFNVSHLFGQTELQRKYLSLANDECQEQDESE